MYIVRICSSLQICLWHNRQLQHWNISFFCLILVVVVVSSVCVTRLPKRPLPPQLGIPSRGDLHILQIKSFKYDHCIGGKVYFKWTLLKLSWCAFLQPAPVRHVSFSVRDLLFYRPQFIFVQLLFQVTNAEGKQEIGKKVETGEIGKVNKRQI